jgi:hypothetical protein
MMGILYTHWPWIVSAAVAYVAIAMLAAVINGSRRGRQEKQAEIDRVAGYNKVGGIDG